MIEGNDHLRNRQYDYDNEPREHKLRAGPYALVVGDEGDGAAVRGVHLLPVERRDGLELEVAEVVVPRRRHVRDAPVPQVDLALPVHGGPPAGAQADDPQDEDAEVEVPRDHGLLPGEARRHDEVLGRWKVEQDLLKKFVHIYLFIYLF